MAYKLLEIENLPQALKNKPRWVSCLVFTGGLLAMTLSAVCIGIFLGYSYFYFEYRPAIKTGNLTHLMTMQIVRLPFSETKEAQYNRTLHGAIMSSTFVTKLAHLSRSLAEDGLDFGSKTNDET